ncbi:KH domain-containing protein, partial [Trifolium medium]|nr:KH domain-containing protein [Trifolium medium]
NNMGERIPSGNGNGSSYFQFPPHPHPGPVGLPPSPIRSSDHRERYMAELLAERQKLGPFLQVLPQCTRLLTQEIRRISGFNQGFAEHERFEPDSPFRPLGQHPNSMPMDMEGWPAVPRE